MCPCNSTGNVFLRTSFLENHFQRIRVQICSETQSFRDDVFINARNRNGVHPANQCCRESGMRGVLHVIRHSQPSIQQHSTKSEPIEFDKKKVVCIPRALSDMTTRIYHIETRAVSYHHEPREVYDYSYLWRTTAKACGTHKRPHQV